MLIGKRKILNCIPVLILAIVLFLTGCYQGISMEENPVSDEKINGTVDESAEGNLEASGEDNGYPDPENETKETDPIGLKLQYIIVDTGQDSCYGNNEEITFPEVGESFYGQDAEIDGPQPSYKDNGDGTITDLNTGLMWQQDPGDKMTYDEAVSGTGLFSLAGYDDWRLPTIKELYSLILFTGTDPSGPEAGGAIPFIDTDYFYFEYGDEASGERMIDSQFISSTQYVSTTMGGNDTVFGVNFADGRIKGYPESPIGGQPDGKAFFVLYVRGNTGYGINEFNDNGDGTITDNATGLMWSQTDSGDGMTWEEALDWAQEKNEENFLGYSDWRVPNAKELQSIVDYGRSPDTSKTAAIDPLFQISEIINEAGNTDYPFFWTSTTHVKSNGIGDSAVYISFGRALGYMEVFGGWVDVHGAGAQRSDPKSGNMEDYPLGHGPQGDAIRIDNYVRLVRN